MKWCPVYDPARCALFALGRNAMYAACVAMGLRPDDEVITPAFDCDGALQPFRVLGSRLRFVRSDPATLAVDVADVRRALTPRTKLLHIVHHFGLPQPWEALTNIRRETGVPILEDNAYSLFSALNGQPFGTWGDAAIFSFRKNLPVAEGGMLRVNTTAYAAALRDERPPAGATVNGQTVLQAVKQGLRYHQLPGRVRRWIRRRLAQDIPPPPLYSDPARGVPAWPFRDVIGPEFADDYVRSISRAALTQLDRLTVDEYQELVQRKRWAYDALVPRLAEMPGVRVLWPTLPEGIVPWGVAVLIAEGRRDAVWERLRHHHAVLAWPTLPQAVIERLDHFPDVELLGRQLLLLSLPGEVVRSPDADGHLQSLTEELHRALAPMRVMVEDPVAVRP